MSTPEERLKQAADRLEAEQRVREQKQREKADRIQSEVQQRAQKASTERQAWLKRTGELVAATRKLVPYHVSELTEGPGFEVVVGTARIRVVLYPDGWHVATTSPPELHPTTGLPTDLPRVRDQILERMVERGLRDLFEGRVAPAPRE